MSAAPGDARLPACGRLSPGELARARAVAAAVPDPEIPVLTLEDLGILRDVRDERGRVAVTLTPTYTGCPATEAISADVRDALEGAGFARPLVTIALAPPWTTDWISERGRSRLRAYGIAPPGERCGRAGAAAALRFSPRCPRCDSARTEAISQYGSTPCKALYRCRACREPFDYFKPY